MKLFRTNFFRTLVATLFLGVGAIVNAHPGPPGHYHPDEVDEFDQVAVSSPVPANTNDFNLASIIVLTGVGACLGFAFFQKKGGIWKDVTAHH